jgi:spore maturation protein SpmA
MIGQPVTRHHRVEARRHQDLNMGSENLLRVVATLVGGGFVVCAVAAIVRGTFYDSDDGPLDRATQPVAFWLSVVSMTVLGLFILGVGHRWEIVRMVFALADRPF